MSEVLLALVAADLLDDVARCAAAAGYRLEVATASDCRAQWLRAAAVVVDPAALDQLVSTAVPRRPGVFVVSAAEPPAITWRAAMDLGATDAALLPADEGHLVRALTRLRSPAGRRGRGIAFIGAHGGAGTSILATAVALTAADAGERVLMLDADDLGSGLDLVLGLERVAGLRWQDLVLAGGTVGGQALHHALPRVDDRLALLTVHRDDPRPIAADAVLVTIDAGRANGDLVIVDLPRVDSEVVRSAVESVDLAVLVTSPTVAGCAAARQVAGRLLTGAAEVALVIRGPSPGGLTAKQVADAVEVPLLTAFRPDPRLPARLDSGQLRIGGRGPLWGAARAVYARLGPGRAG